MVIGGVASGSQAGALSAFVPASLNAAIRFLAPSVRILYKIV